MQQKLSSIVIPDVYNATILIINNQTKGISAIIEIKIMMS